MYIYSLEAITQEVSDPGKTGFLQVFHVQAMPENLLYDTPAQKQPSLCTAAASLATRTAFDGIMWE